VNRTTVDRTREERALRAVGAARGRLILGRGAASAFFATLVLRLTAGADESVPTAATDGRRLVVNPAFVLGLTADELVGVLAHEVMHCALAHHARRAGREPGRWNVACDLAINPLLEAVGLTLPRGRLLPGAGTYSDLPAGKSAEEYYARLADDDAGETASPEEVGTDPGGCGAVADAADASPADAKVLVNQWQAAVAQAHTAARSRGELPAGLARAADAAVHPPADWRALLREFVASHARNDYAWHRPNRRYLAQGLYLPGLHSDELGDVVIAVDTSGSVGERELGLFAAEASALLDAYACTATVLYHDARVQGVSTWTPADGPLVLTPVGGGGTSHRCVFDWLARSALDPACVVCLTDLETDFPVVLPGVPVLWAVVGDCAVTPPFGRVVRLGV
jgi:predicted metal-dependent peptidase